VTNREANTQKESAGLRSRVPTILTTSIFSGPFPDVIGSRTCKSSGATIAEDPASITILLILAVAFGY
jgi:hypothetical protein